MTRRVAAVAGAVAVVFALSGCEKPTPLATVTVGSDSVSDEAKCYTEGKELAEKELRGCLTAKGGKTLTVHDGQKIRIGVEPEIAETGWALLVNGQGAMTEASKETYKTFDYDEVFAPQQSQTGGAGPVPKTAQVAIAEVDEKGKAKGAWQFNLKRAS